MNQQRPRFFLSRLIDRNQATIISEQSDAQKITKLVELDRIDWIGIEHPKTDTTYVDIANDLYFNSLDYFTSWEQLFNWDSIKTNQLLFLIYEAFVIARANHPEVFHEIEIYPLEDRDLMIILNNYTDEVNYWDGFVYADPYVTSDQRSEIFSFINTTIIPIPRLITESEFEALLDQIGIREESRGNIRMLRMAHNNVMSFISRRDAAVVQSILDLPGNGLILSGEAHGHGIKQGLIEACQNRDDSPR